MVKSIVKTGTEWSTRKPTFGSQFERLSESIINFRLYIIGSMNNLDTSTDGGKIVKKRCKNESAALI